MTDIYHCPKRHCDWTLTVEPVRLGGSVALAGISVANVQRWKMQATELSLEDHIATHPIWRRIMARRVRKLVA